jgi:hypothetical protein
MTQPTAAIATLTPAELAGALIHNPQELAERVRSLQAQAHLVTPMVAVSAIAPSHAINIAVVVIDPSVDATTGAGADVYHQPSIHKTKKVGEDWQPLEVSLGKTGLLKIAHAAGITWVESHRTDDGHSPYYWAWTAVGEVVDFDGTRRRLPPGSVEIDLRDGSPQIGGWTVDKWIVRVQEADAKRLTTAKADQWKVKPEPIGGWTGDRVMAARRFGLRLAESKAMNAVTRGLGLKSKYTVTELQKPFVVLRCSFVPDLKDPEVKRLVTERGLGGSRLLYPRRTHEPEIIDVTPQPADQETAGPGSAPQGNGRPVSVGAPAVPESVDELAALPQVTTPAAAPVRELYHITFVGQRPEKDRIVYVVKTQETKDRELETVDREIARAALHAYKASAPVALELEHVTDDGGDQWVIVELEGEAPPARSATAAAALTVVDVQQKSGTTSDRPWTKTTIVLSDGRTGVTFDAKKADEAEATKAAGVPVRVKLEPSEKYPDQLDVIEFGAIDTRQQTLPIGAGDKL